MEAYIGVNEALLGTECDVGSPDALLGSGSSEESKSSDRFRVSKCVLVAGSSLMLSTALVMFNCIT